MGTSFKLVEKAPPEELASLAEGLRELAARVEAGEVLAVAWTWADGDHRWHSEYLKARMVDPMAIQGALAQMSYDFASGAFELKYPSNEAE